MALCGREAVDGECIDLSTSVCQVYDPTHSSFVIRHSRVCFARFQAAEPSLLAAVRVKMSRYCEANPQPGQDGTAGGEGRVEDERRRGRDRGRSGWQRGVKITLAVNESVDGKGCS